MITQEMIDEIRKKLFTESESVLGNDMIDVDFAMEIIMEYFENRGLFERGRQV